MESRLFLVLGAAAALLFSLDLGASSQAVGPEPPQIDAQFLDNQFGEQFTLLPAFAPLVADFDGDGIEDVAIVAKAKNPLADEIEHHYKVLDPFDAFYGTGDPKITSTFGTEDPEHRGMVLLIIHGAGSEAWRSLTPKAKFVIINLPFKQVAIKHLQIRKKRLPAIYAEETGGDQMTSAIFFDGKKYRYEPMGSNME